MISFFKKNFDFSVPEKWDLDFPKVVNYLQLIFHGQISSQINSGVTLDFSKFMRCDRTEASKDIIDVPALTPLRIY